MGLSFLGYMLNEFRGLILRNILFYLWGVFICFFKLFMLLGIQDVLR